jgi:hypothetical protein
MSNVEAAISQKAREVPPGSLRQTVLLSAKRFKSTWVELGKLLVQVRNDALYESWGFESFDLYCSKELHIRKATADKLTRSFSFLAKHEPKAMAAEDIVETAPAFEVVEVLASAEERGQLSAQEYRSIRDSIWEPQKPVSELKREFVERYPRPAAEGNDATHQLRRLASFARKLANELASSRKVPKAISERAAALADDVEELVGGNDA